MVAQKVTVASEPATRMDGGAESTVGGGGEYTVWLGSNVDPAARATKHEGGGTGPRRCNGCKVEGYAQGE